MLLFFHDIMEKQRAHTMYRHRTESNHRKWKGIKSPGRSSLVNGGSNAAIMWKYNDRDSDDVEADYGDVYRQRKESKRHKWKGTQGHGRGTSVDGGGNAVNPRQHNDKDDRVTHHKRDSSKRTYRNRHSRQHHDGTGVNNTDNFKSLFRNGQARVPKRDRDIIRGQNRVAQARLSSFGKITVQCPREGACAESTDKNTVTCIADALCNQVAAERQGALGTTSGTRPRSVEVGVVPRGLHRCERWIPKEIEGHSTPLERDIIAAATKMNQLCLADAGARSTGYLYI
jgi:hypothetical protein